MRSVPIFVSSPFRGFHRERDSLRDLVVPQLNAALSKHGAQVELVDLRWGVDTEALAGQDDKHYRVLEVCFREIRRCSPLFLGILGDMAGWVPSQHLVQRVAESQQIELDDLRATVGLNPSITALEVWFGALHGSDQAVIVRRKSGESDDVRADPEWSALEARVVEKSAVGRLAFLDLPVPSDSAGDDMRHFASSVAGALMDPVMARVSSLAGTSTASTPSLGPPVSEVVAGRTLDIETLLARIAHEEVQGLVITGVSGIGKTTVMGEVERELRGRGVRLGSAFLGGDGSPVPESDLVEELALQLDLGEPPAHASSGSLSNAELHNWWAAQLADLDSSVVILIDALDNLATERPREALHVIRHRYGGPRWLISTSNDDQAKGLEMLGLELQELPALTTDGASQALQEWAAQNGSRQIPRRALEQMSSRERSGIWTVLAVTALTWLGMEDFKEAENAQESGLDADAAITELLLRRASALPDVDPELARQLTSRAVERLGVVGESWLHLLALARDGLTLDELTLSSGAMPVDSARARWMMGSLLLEDGAGRLRLRHDLVRRAALGDSTEANQARAHRLLADTYLRYPREARDGRRSALWHVLMSGDADALRRFADRHIDVLSDGWAQDVAATAIVASRVSNGAALRSLTGLAALRPPPDHAAPSSVLLNGTLSIAKARGASLDERRALLQTMFHLFRARGEQIRGEYLLLQFAALKRDEGRLTEAVTLFDSALPHFEDGSVVKAQILYDVAQVRRRLGRGSEALDDARRGLLVTATLPRDDRNSIITGGLALLVGGLLADMGDLQGAIGALKEAWPRLNTDDRARVSQFADALDPASGSPLREGRLQPNEAELEQKRRKAATSGEPGDVTALVIALLRAARQGPSSVKSHQLVAEASQFARHVVKANDRPESWRLLVDARVAEAELSPRITFETVRELVEMSDRCAVPPQSLLELRVRYHEQEGQSSQAWALRAQILDAYRRDVREQRDGHLPRTTLVLTLHRYSIEAAKSAQLNLCVQLLAEALETLVRPNRLVSGVSPESHVLRELSHLSPEMVLKTSVNARTRLAKARILFAEVTDRDNASVPTRLSKAMRGKGLEELAHLAMEREDFADAARYWEQLLPLSRSLALENPSRFQQDFVYELDRASICYSKLGRLNDQISVVEEQIKIGEARYATEPTSRQAVRNLLIAYHKRSQIQEMSQKYRLSVVRPRTTQDANQWRRKGCKVGQQALAEGTLGKQDQRLVDALCRPR